MKRIVSSALFISLFMATTPVVALSVSMQQSQNVPAEKTGDFVTDIKNVLPLECAQYAHHVAGLLELDGISSIDDVTPQMLDEVLQFVVLREADGSCKQRCKTPTFKELISSYSPSKRTQLMGCLYVLYRKFFHLYKKEQGGVSIKLRAADQAIRAFALLKNIAHQKDKYMPLIEFELAQMAMGQQSELTENASRALDCALRDIVGGWADPDHYDNKVMLPLQLLIKTVPAAVYHFFRKDFSYGLSEQIKASEHLTKMLGDGWTSKQDKLLKTVTKAGEWMTEGAAQKAGKLTASALYQDAVKSTSEMIAHSAAKKIEQEIKDRVDSSKLSKLKNWTLGIVRPEIITYVAQNVVAPLGLKTLSNAVSDTPLATVIPQFDNHSMGMITRETLTMERNGQQQEVKLFRNMSTTQFLKNKAIEYGLISTGAFAMTKFVQMLTRHRSTLVKGVYGVTSWFAQGLVKIGFCSQNPVRRMGRAVARQYKKFLCNRPHMVYDALSMAYMLCRQEGGRFSIKDLPVIEASLMELNQLKQKREFLKHLRSIKSFDQAQELSEHIDETQLRLIDTIDQAGILGRVCDCGIDMVFLQDFSIGKRLLEWLGSGLFVNFGHRQGWV